MKRTRGWLKALMGFFLCIFLTLRAAATEANEKNGSQIQSILERSNLLITRVEAAMVGSHEANGTIHRPLNEALKLANEASQKGNFSQAAALLKTPIEDPAAPSSALYDSALYAYSSAHFQANNLSLAREGFERLLKSGKKNYLQKSIAQLLIIAQKQLATDERERLLGLLVKDKKIDKKTPAQEAYIFGKNLVHANKTAALGIRYLELVGTQNEHYAQARYLMGVGEAQRRHWDLAIAQFNEASVQASDQSLKELSTIAIARVNAKQGFYEQAITRYGQLSQSSPYFDDALFESAWCAVLAAQSTQNKRAQEKSLQRAQIALDTLIRSPHSNLKYPNARIMKAHVALWLGNDDAAEAEFKAIASHFEKVRIQIEKSALTPQMIGQYFQYIQSNNQKNSAWSHQSKEKNSDEREWIQSFATLAFEASGIDRNRIAERISSLVRSAEAADQNYRLALARSQGISALLTLPGIESRYPFISEAALNPFTLRSRLLDNMESCLDAMRDTLLTHLSAAQMSTIDRFLTVRLAAKSRLFKTPKLATELARQRAYAQTHLQYLENKWFEETLAQKNFANPQSLSTLQSAELRREIEKESTLAEQISDRAAPELSAQQALAKAMDEEFAALESMQKAVDEKLTTEESDNLESLQKIYEKSGQLHTQLGVVFETQYQVAKKRFNEVRLDLARNSDWLSAQQKVAIQMNAQAESLTAALGKQMAELAQLKAKETSMLANMGILESHKRRLAKVVAQSNALYSQKAAGTQPAQPKPIQDVKP